jgi:hypothetical protein
VQGPSLHLPKPSSRSESIADDFHSPLLPSFFSYHQHLILTLGRQFERARLRDYAAADNKPTAPGFVNKLLWKMYYRDQQQEKVKAWEKDMAEWEEKMVAHQKRKDEREARRVERERVKKEKRRAKGKGREEKRESEEKGDGWASDAKQVSLILLHPTAHEQETR